MASWVIGANVKGKRFVALQLEVAHHFIERWAGRRARRLEPPATFRTAKTAKMRLIDPHELPIHPPISPRPTLSGHACYLLAVRGRSVLLSQQRTEWLRQNTLAQSGHVGICIE
jgi:hypothetical protein